MSGKHDLPGVELVDGAASAPQVHGEVVLQPEDDFRSSVESGDEKSVSS